MSAEDLQGLTLQGVQQLRDVLKGYDVTVVFLHRNRLALAKSVWLELSKVRVKRKRPVCVTHTGVVQITMRAVL